MSRNTLKIIACVSMLIDHIGLILLPEVHELRLIGRIAMPIFAFFIGEGCIYTRNRKKYFMRVFLLGVLCQCVYVVESLLTRSDGWGYMNILLTFSVSIGVCYSFLDMKGNFLCEGKNKIRSVVVFALAVAGVFVLDKFSQNSWIFFGTKIEFDYGAFGMFLPLFAAVSKDKRIKLLSFSLVMLITAYDFYSSDDMFLWAMVSVALLWFYNGQSGKANLKYFFYAFYPVHLAVLYLISFIK